MKFQLAQLSLPLLAMFSTGLSIAETPKADMTGPVTRAEIDAQKFDWMGKGMAEAKKDLATKKKEVETLKKALKNVDVEVFFGSWCGDTHEHLPVFLALMDAAKANGPKSTLLVARDRKKNTGSYKDTRGIERLPTFVFLKDGKEIGRIIETPTKSILEDTLAIIGKSSGSP